MLLSYLNAAFRLMLKQRYFFIVNVLGLSLGLTACLMILQYTNYHSSFDRRNPDAKNIYRVWYQRDSENGDVVRFASACPPIGPQLKQHFPEVESFARLFKYDCVGSFEDIAFKEERVFYAEPNILKLLSVPLVLGDTTGVLSSPDKVLLSRSTAERYYGSSNPVGKIWRLNKKKVYTVAGIFSDFPDNVHLKVDVFLPWNSFEYTHRPGFNDAWFNSGFYTYVRLRNGVDPLAFESKIQPMVDSEIGDFLRENKVGMSFGLQPLTSIHLNSHLMQEVEVNGNRRVVDFLKIIAWFILIIAWVNYVNLSTISSLKRAREIGIRKVVGSGRLGLVTQLAVEGAIVGLVAIVFSVMIVELFQGQYLSLSGLPLSSGLWTKPWTYAVLAGVFLLVTFTGGIYTALVIVTRPIVSTLRGEVSSGTGGAKLKRAMVVFQYAIAIAMLAGTSLVFLQLKHLRTQDLRFDPSNIAALPFPSVGDSTLALRVASFKEELARYPFVEAVSQTSAIPGKPNIFNRGGISRVGADQSSGKNYRITVTDSSYLRVFRVKMVDGGWLQQKSDGDLRTVVVNLNAMHDLGFNAPEQAIGQRIYIDGNNEFTIVGVVDDFFQLSPKEAIEPQIFAVGVRLPMSLKGFLAIRTKNPMSAQQLSMIEKDYHKFFPDNPYNYLFIDSFYNSQYSEEERFGRVFGLFSFLALFITALGLTSLTAYTGEQRRREFGIRKVLGATSTDIVKMLLSGYLFLAFIATFLIFPVIYYAGNSWLESFPLRIKLFWWIFVLPPVLISLLTGIVVYLQSIKYAKMNPVEAIHCD